MAQLKKYHADKLILSVDGIDAERGFTTYYNKESALDVAMIEGSDCRIIAADHSKFGHCAFAKISEIGVADYVVTDVMPSKEKLEEFELLGVKVLA